MICANKGDKVKVIDPGALQIPESCLPSSPQVVVGRFDNGETEGVKILGCDRQGKHKVSYLVPDPMYQLKSKG
jgi:hypothetical protein